MRKTALMIVIITLLSKIFGFLREIVLSYYYGAGTISDAYLISFTIPGFIFSFIGIGLATSFIPMYSNIEKEKGTEEADTFTSNLMIAILAITSILVLIMYIFAYPTVKIFAMGFDNETLQLGVRFTRISIFGIFISVSFHLISSYLNLKGNYHIPAFAGIPNNIVVILSICLSSVLGTVFLPIGIVVALISQLFLVLIFIKKYNFKFKPTQIFKDRNLRKIFYLSIPVIIGVSVNQINVLVDRTLASTIAIGGISALNYANRLNTFVQGIFVLSITTAMYPLISKLVATGDIKGLKNTVSEIIISVSIMVIPITMGTIIFSNQIVDLVFGRGAFNLKAINMTTSALFFYSLGMIGFGLREVLSRVFYAFQDTKTPMFNAAIGMILNIILNIILSRYLGIGGLALATSIAALFTTALLFISLRKKIGSFGMKQISISFLKILFASLTMSLLAKQSFNYLIVSLSQNISLIIAIGIGTLSYFVIIYFMKIKDVDIITQMIRSKFIKKAS